MLTLCINVLYINGGKHTVLDFREVSESGPISRLSCYGKR